MANDDPRVALRALNDHMAQFNSENHIDRAWLQDMVLVRAVLMVACELRAIREIYADREPA